MAMSRISRGGPAGFPLRYLTALRAHVKPVAKQRRGPAGRLGLLRMRERTGMVGGTFSVRSSKESGTTVRADFPLPEHADA